MLCLRPRSKQLVLFLIDDLLTRKVHPATSYELLCVGAVIFIVKFEGDFTVHLPAFNDFVLISLKLSLSAMKATEVIILNNLPTNFALLVTFSEMNDFLIGSLKLRVNLRPHHQASLNELTIQAYIHLPLGYSWFSLTMACFFACDKVFKRQIELIDFLVVSTEKTYKVKLSSEKDKLQDLLIALEAINKA